MQQVFISYSSKEYDRALQVRQIVEENGFSVWMAPKSIPAGSDYATEIPKAIKSCAVFLLLLSDASQASQWVPKELDLAITFGKVIIPFHIDRGSIIDAFNFRLTNVQRIDAFDAMESAYQELIHTIAGVVASKKSGAEEQSTSAEEPQAPVEENADDGEREMTREEIVAYNKAQRIELTKTILLIVAVVAGLALVMFGVNRIFNNTVNEYLQMWFDSEDAKSIAEVEVKNSVGLLITSVIPSTFCLWLFARGYDIDSPALKILAGAAYVLAALLLHLLPYIFVAAVAIVIFIGILKGFLFG